MADELKSKDGEQGQEEVVESSFDETALEDTAETKVEANTEIENGEVSESISTDEDQPEKTPRLSRSRRIFRKILVWLVVIALAFAAGFFVDAYLRYIPTLDKLTERTNQVSEAMLEIDELEAEISRLSTFEETNQILVEENQSLETHLRVLSARSAVADARLAVVQDNIPEAKLAVSKVESTLEDLVGMLTEDQVEVVENMQQRLDLIREELEEDTFSALSDLEVLSSKLGGLENTLFATP
jgi:cell division protein FtsL